MKRWLFSRVSQAGKVAYIVGVIILLLCALAVFRLMERGDLRDSVFVALIVGIVPWALICLKLFPKQKPAD